MSNYSWPKGHNKYYYVFKTREDLNKIETQRRARGVLNMRKKWVATAIIALASGSTVLLSQANSAQAATENPTVSNVKVSVVENENDSQNSNNTNQETNQEDTQAENADQNKVQAQNEQSAVQSQKNQDTAQSQDQQTQVVQDNKQSVPEPANQADHVKGNVQSAWNQGYRGQNTVVAVIDSGADPSHKDFQTMPSDPRLIKDEMQEKIDQQGY